MLSDSPQPEEQQKGPFLLGQAIELLRRELSTLANGNWQNLPDLKKQKVALASRLGKFEWPPGSVDREPVDLRTLKSLITDLEGHSRQKIQGQLDLIGNQILALQELHQYWLECQNVSFRKLYDSIPLS
jgi:hypothetical protein